MEIEFVLETDGAAVAGIDRVALVADIQAELDKFVLTAGAPPAEPTPRTAPAGAQGDWTAIHWLLHVAAEPSMAKVYAQGLIFAINTILEAAKSKETKGSEASRKETTSASLPGKPSVTVKMIGKEIALPATTIAIRLMLDQLGNQ